MSYFFAGIICILFIKFGVNLGGHEVTVLPDFICPDERGRLLLLDG